jgi:hypothetical protein
MLLSGGNDGLVKLWNFDLHAYFENGCRLIRGYLQNSPQVNDDERELCQDSP